MLVGNAESFRGGRELLTPSTVGSRLQSQRSNDPLPFFGRLPEGVGYLRQLSVRFRALRHFSPD